MLKALLSATSLLPKHVLNNVILKLLNYIEALLKLLNYTKAFICW